MQTHRAVGRLIAGRVILILSLALALFGSGPALARGNSLEPVTWYVATTGLDENSCTTIEAPCQTINGAIGKAAAGDIVKVAVGTYAGTGDSVIEVSKNITLSGGWDETFSAQTGRSTIDGGDARRGLGVESGVTALLEHITLQNGNVTSGGGGIHNAGTLTVSDSAVVNNSFATAIHNTSSGILTLNHSTVNHNGSTESCFTIVNEGTFTTNASVVEENTGSFVYCEQLTIVNYSGTMTLDNTAVRNNSGGGILNYATLTVNNSLISGNVKTSGWVAGGISNWGGALTVNNSTISGNTGAEGINNFTGSLILNNSTVTGNTGGIDNGGTTTLRNSIIAGNTDYDCYGSITSSGYNLIGRDTFCTFAAGTGDKVGTDASPIDPQLLPLGDHGGPTFTQALMGGSPAINAGNPAPPGSEADACLVTDQRGVARPVDGTCDMGAYEGYVTGVVSITRLNANPTSAASVKFEVKFSDVVTGVDITAPFSDFVLTKTGITGGSITSVSGSGFLYTVTVNTGKNNGTLRLGLVDDDSILDVSANPLGGPGLGNGDFTAGEIYTIKKIPAVISPAGTSSWDPTPTYKWSKIPAATKYNYQLYKGTRLVYSKIVSASACGASACQNTPATSLASGVYKWRVQAMTEGTWKPFSPYKSFTITGPKAGYWKGYGVDYYVTPNQSSVDDYSIYISVSGCGNYKVTHPGLIPIVNRKFGFAGSFYASGTFSSVTNASGKVGLSRFYIQGCGYVSGGPFSWSAAWLRSSQPDPLAGAQIDPFFLPLPVLKDPFPGMFTVDPMP